MEETLKLILEKLNSIESEVKKTNKRIDSLENMIIKHSNDQTRLVVEAIESLENRTVGRTERMEVRQAKLTDRVDILEADISIIQGKLID